MNNLFSVCRKSDKKGGKIIWTESQIAYITSEYQKNYSVPSIAKQFGVSSQVIRNVLRKANVKLLSIEELQKIDYPRNSNFFDVIDTPEKAYWLGFMYADGYIGIDNRIRITLKKQDESHLYKFLEAIEAKNTKVKDTKKIDKRTNKIYDGCYCCLRDKQLKKELEKKGCMNCKSLILTFPSNDIVPDYLMFHFIRGYFDGDGCLTYTISGKNKTPGYKIVFVGTESFLMGLRKFLGKEKIALEYRDNYCNFTIGGNKQLVSILENIYKDSNEKIELTRKRQIYNTFLLQSFGSEPKN